MAKAQFPWKGIKNPSSIQELADRENDYEGARLRAKHKRVPHKNLGAKQYQKTAPLDPTYLRRPWDELTPGDLQDQRPASRYGKRGRSKA